DLVRAARHVHVSSYFLLPRLAAQLPAWFHDIRTRGGSTSLDTNDDPAATWAGVAAALAETDVALPNEAEALALTGRPDGDVYAAAEALAETAGTVVIKRGAAGALAWAGGPIGARGVAVDPVDTVGAGDSFNAGFLAGRLTGLDLSASLRLAVACGSLSTRAAGGTAAQPTLAEALATAQTLPASGTRAGAS